jgi:hypothetical protein
MTNVQVTVYFCKIDSYLPVPFRGHARAHEEIGLFWPNFLLCNRKFGQKNPRGSVRKFTTAQGAQGNGATTARPSSTERGSFCCV